jgi:hypothetical protein
LKTVLAGLAAYLLICLLGWLKVEMERPPACSKGHTDHYCVNRWRCRTCAVATERRGLRKLARERTREAARRDRG